MRRIVYVFAVLATFTVCSLMLWGHGIEHRAVQAFDPDNLIRLRVVAASDSPRDQEIKYEVRDVMLQLLNQPLEHVKQPGEAYLILQSWIPRIEEKADEVLAANGVSYEANARLCQGFAPTRRYGSTVVPPGWYETLEIVLGQGKGENWWCVVFPPLCFIDCTNPQTSASASTLTTGSSRSATVILEGDQESRVEARFWALEALRHAQQQLRFMVAYVSNH